MSPVDPRFLRSERARQKRVIWHTCPKCDYDLTGLTKSIVCPECGTPITMASSDPSMKPAGTARANLTDAPISYLRLLKKSALMLGFLCMLELILLIVVPYLTGFGLKIVGSVGTIFALVWTLGVWNLTKPRPFVAGMMVAPKTEYVRTRLVARSGQCAWVASFLFRILADSLPAGSAATQVALVLVQVSILIGVLGVASLCLWLAHLAEWGQATTHGWRLRIIASLLAVSTTYLALYSVLHALLKPGAILGLLTLLSFFAWLGYIGGIGMFIFALFRFHFLAAWAIKNARSAADRDLRVLERKARRTFTGQAPAGSLLESLTKARGDAALDPCAHCGYDLTGLPPGVPCPECGHELEGSYARRPRQHLFPPDPTQNDPLPLAGDEDGPDAPEVPEVPRA